MHSYACMRACLHWYLNFEKGVDVDKDRGNVPPLFWVHRYVPYMVLSYPHLHVNIHRLFNQDIYYADGHVSTLSDLENFLFTLRLLINKMSSKFYSLSDAMCSCSLYFLLHLLSLAGFFGFFFASLVLAQCRHSYMQCWQHLFIRHLRVLVYR